MSPSHDAGGRDAREWEAQERARREEQLGITPDAPDANGARVNEYRLLARVLRHPPLDPIPHDFAARTAARAKVSDVEDDRLEVWLQTGLLVLLTTGGVWALAAAFGRPWWQTLARAVPETATRPLASWSAAILACLALSSLLDQWRRRREGEDSAPR